MPCPPRTGARNAPHPLPVEGWNPRSVVATLQAFKALAEGEYDHVPEQAFFMCGGLEDLERNAHELMKG